MELKYDIYTLQNAEGTGEERKFVKLKQYEPMSENELARSIEQRCSLTKGDVKAVLATLHDYAVREMSEGRRFYVPELGYFSLSVGLEKDEENPDKKIRGNDIRLRGINFRPEKQLVEEITQRVRFVRSRYSSQSTKYTEQDLWGRLCEYFESHRILTCRVMRIEYGLTQYTAKKWLDLFVERGLLVKDGTNHSPIYLKA